MTTSIIRQSISVASIALFLGGLLWVAAFWLPVFETEQRDIAGYWVFLSGWMGFVVFQFAWYANLLLLVAVILMYNSPVRATLLAALGLLVATQAFWFDALPETTKSVEIIARGPGFWLWYAGIFLMSVGVFFCSDTDEVTEVTEVKAETLLPVTDSGEFSVSAAQPVTDNGELDIPAAQQQPVSGVSEQVAVKPAAEQIAEPQNGISLVAQLEAVRKAKQKTLDQQKRADSIKQAEQEERDAALRAIDEEQMEGTVPAVRAILADALFGGDKKAGAQQLPAFLLNSDDETAKL